MSFKVVVTGHKHSTSDEDTRKFEEKAADAARAFAKDLSKLIGKESESTFTAAADFSQLGRINLLDEEPETEKRSTPTASEKKS